MAGRKPVEGELAAYLRKEYDIRRQLLEGKYNPQELLGALQSVGEGRFGEIAVPVTRQKPRLIHGIFVSAEAQMENVRRWNEEHEWGFGEDVFETLPQPPEWPEDRMVAVVLVPYFQTVQGTFDGLWEVAASRQKKYWRWPDLRSDADHLRLLQGVEHQPGLRWEVIDLAANWDKKDGTSPETVRSPESSPHAGILAAAAHHPKWVQAMDGVKVPYVWIPGYEATIPGGEWRVAPGLSFDRDDRLVRLRAGGCGYRRSSYAVPSFREGAQH